MGPSLEPLETGNQEFQQNLHLNSKNIQLDKRTDQQTGSITSQLSLRTRNGHLNPSRGIFFLTHVYITSDV